jgi:hypothetical protein
MPVNPTRIAFGVPGLCPITFDSVRTRLKGYKPTHIVPMYVRVSWGEVVIRGGYRSMTVIDGRGRSIPRKPKGTAMGPGSVRLPGPRKNELREMWAG